MSTRMRAVGYHMTLYMWAMGVLLASLVSGCAAPPKEPYTVWFHVETGDAAGLPTSRNIDTLGMAIQADGQVAVRLLDLKQEPPGNYMITGTPSDPIVTDLTQTAPGTGNADRRPYTLPRSTPLLFPQTLSKHIVTAGLTTTLHGTPGETISCLVEINHHPVEGSYVIAEIKTNASQAVVTCLHLW